MNKQKSILSNIIDYVLGTKYYVNVVNVAATSECEACCYIFPTKHEADLHRADLRFNDSFKFVETVSFRSRHAYYAKRRPQMNNE
jgi:hypothetical protein